jgi:hypothetical protein
VLTCARLFAPKDAAATKRSDARRVLIFLIEISGYIGSHGRDIDLCCFHERVVLNASFESQGGGSVKGYKPT